MIKVDHAMPLLVVEHATKSFAGVVALNDVALEVLPGEVHCLMGQNGAGKSTLIKMLAGAHTPDAGEIRRLGEPVTLPDPQAAIDLGIATMYQELDIVDGLTVAENIFLGHEFSTAGWVRTAEQNRQARRLLARLGHGDLPVTADAGGLSAANKQIVSMARALSHDTRLIVMDEPSAVLDAEEVKNLFRVVEELTNDGIAVIYISHRLEEIRRIGDRITVLKDGRTVAQNLDVASTTTTELVRLMTGRAVESIFPPRQAPGEDAPEVLEVESLGLDGVFDGITFSVRAGEVIGLAGLVGSGRSEILETIYGARRATTGEVRVHGRVLRNGSIPSAVSAGIGLSPEERKSQGLLLTEPIYQNVTLSSFTRHARGGFLNFGAERRVAREQIDALQLRPADPERPAGALSGGNQQKILLGRWLAHGTDVLLLDEPTRGVDIGARADIYALIAELASSGNAIVVVSSEIDEVLGLSDRVLIVSEGEVLAELPASDTDEHDVLDIILKGTAA